MTSQTPLRVRISGTTVARRTKFGHNVHRTQPKVISVSDLGLDPWGAPQDPRTGPIKRECVVVCPAAVMRKDLQPVSDSDFDTQV